MKYFKDVINNGHRQLDADLKYNNGVTSRKIQRLNDLSSRMSEYFSEMITLLETDKVLSEVKIVDKITDIYGPSIRTPTNKNDVHLCVDFKVSQHSENIGVRLAIQTDRQNTGKQWEIENLFSDLKGNSSFILSKLIEYGIPLKDEVKEVKKKKSSTKDGE